MKPRIGSLKTLLHRQTETTVSNKNECITKFMTNKKFSSMLCHTAKRNQRYNLVQSPQNDSTSIEHNFKTLAQNKFNICQPIQNIMSSLSPNSTLSQSSSASSNTFHFMRFSRLCLSSLSLICLIVIKQAYIYIYR